MKSFLEILSGRFLSIPTLECESPRPRPESGIIGQQPKSANNRDKKRRTEISLLKRALTKLS
jgi:hypothetical protein